jgi:hypothetical protein
MERLRRMCAMTNRPCRVLLAGPLAALLLAPGAVVAQGENDTIELTAPGKWVIGTSFGAGEVSGQYSAFLERPVNLT